MYRGETGSCEKCLLAGSPKLLNQITGGQSQDRKRRRGPGYWTSWAETSLSNFILDEITVSSRRAAEGVGGERDVQNESEQVDTDDGGRVVDTVTYALRKSPFRERG